ncbi:LOW QUALITY PROTEIN: hypothetical protein PanWU01x14_150800 [Parasponia andersonii]|uniref:Uncharacterized protein n=1 Tax=Parasponia andersonii TaxID=3476 RepID=A0A2P5CHX8_PARAD|nr:LOW QUALITY PROTEIN: hypothetical protein PanWU01x14_150800 [Parasponia andersonii]
MQKPPAPRQQLSIIYLLEEFMWFGMCTFLLCSYNRQLFLLVQRFWFS